MQTSGIMIPAELLIIPRWLPLISDCTALTIRSFNITLSSYGKTNLLYVVTTSKIYMYILMHRKRNIEVNNSDQIIWSVVNNNRLLLPANYYVIISFIWQHFICFYDVVLTYICYVGWYSELNQHNIFSFFDKNKYNILQYFPYVSIKIMRSGVVFRIDQRLLYHQQQYTCIDKYFLERSRGHSQCKVYNSNDLSFMPHCAMCMLIHT